MAADSDPYDRRDWLLLGGVLLAAALLRCLWPGWTEFKADEARLLSLAWDMADGRLFPLRGITSSVGVPNFPASVWVYALPLRVWPHVLAPTLFTGLLNTAAVGLTYHFVRRYWGRQAAFAAALFFAVSPWAVIHSRKIWAQNLLPFFAVCWGISGCLALVEGRRAWLIVHLFCAAFAFQIHLAAASLLVGSAVLLVIYRRRVGWRMLLAGAAAGLLPALPLLYDQLILSDRTLADLAGAGSGPGGGWSWNPLLHAVRLATGWEMHALAGPAAFDVYLEGVPDGGWVIQFWLLLVFAGLIRLLRVSRRAGSTSAAPFLLVWMVVPLATFAWFPTPVELHYLLPFYPAWFVAAGLAVEPIGRLPFGRWAIWPLIALSAVWQVWLWVGLLTFIQDHATPGGFGEPLIFQLEAAAAVRAEAARTGAPEVLIAGAGEDPALDAFPAVFALHLRDLPHRFVDANRSAVFPAQGAVLLYGPEEFPLEAVVASVGRAGAVIPRRLGEGSYRLFTLPAEPDPPVAIRFDPPPLLANWVTFLGLTPPDPDGHLQLLWRVGTPAADDFHFFNHLLTAGGGRITQADAAAFSAHSWREGDLVLSHFTLDPPPAGAGPWVLRTGMYRYPSLENIPLLDVAANPYTDAYEISLPR